jgi:predicted TIM-barrel fold metal-dependent hydrolase
VTALQPSATTRPEADLTRIDCDVHPNFREGLADLMPHLPTAWRRRVGVGQDSDWAKDVAASHFSLPTNVLYINPTGAMRRDTLHDDGPPASSPSLVAEQLLDGYDIDRAVLLSGNVLGLGGLPDPDLAAAIASAYNRWLAERWLDADVRYRGAIVVAPQDPALAAAEIDRCADLPGFVQVHVPLTNRLLGERHHHPIFEAAERHGLPVAVHPNAIDGIFRTGPPTAGGTPAYYAEWHTGLTQVFQANLISLVCQGVFERFPGLHVVMTEGGFAWLPDVLWRMDKNWRGLRDELPWLTRAPSEYVFDHVRFTTQPFVEPPRREQVAQLCGMISAERVLLFSTDYPHWDFDDPVRALAPLPAHVRERVFAKNALELYGDRIL